MKGIVIIGLLFLGLYYLNTLYAFRENTKQEVLQYFQILDDDSNVARQVIILKLLPMYLLNPESRYYTCPALLTQSEHFRNKERLFLYQETETLYITYCIDPDPLVSSSSQLSSFLF